VHFPFTRLIPVSRPLIVSAGLLAMIISTGCGSSNWTASQRQTPPTVVDAARAMAAGTSVPLVLLFVGTGTSSSDVSAVKTILGNLKLTYATATSSQLNAMTESTLKTYKLFLMPGGNAITISKYLSSTTITNLHNAIVNDGLRYLGICAGAFFGGSSGIYHYLNLTPSGVWFNYYADEFKGIHKEALEIKGADGKTLDQYWQDGPQLSGWGNIVGKYPDGTPAIVEGYSGKGWVILCGVHPEAPASWRTGMTFTTSVAVDNAYAETLVTDALNAISLTHF
jgi:biotin protein ligase-like protein